MGLNEVGRERRTKMVALFRVLLVYPEYSKVPDFASGIAPGGSPHAAAAS